MKSILTGFLLGALQLTAQSDPDSLPSGKQKGEPFNNADLSWANGNDRRTTNIWKGPASTPFYGSVVC